MKKTGTIIIIMLLLANFIPLLLNDNNTINAAYIEEHSGTDGIAIGDVICDTYNVYTGTHWDTATSGAGFPMGITTNGTNIWICDHADDEVYEYNMTGTSVTHWDTAASGNNAPSGITTDGTNIWICDFDDNVYKYDMDGTYNDSWATFIETSPSGIATDGTNIWVVDVDNGKVYKYDMDGTYTNTFWDTEASGVTYPYGITTDGTNIWNCYLTNQEVYKYSMTGTYITHWDTAATNTICAGITANGTNIYIVDRTGAEVYKYDMVPTTSLSCKDESLGTVITVAIVFFTSFLIKCN